MKRFITILLSLALVVGAIATFSGCKRSKKIDKDGNIFLEFWTIYPEGDTSGGDEWIESLISEFEKDNSNVHINHTGTSFWDYFTKIGTAQTDKNGPDIYMHTTTDNRARAEGGISMDISGYFSDDGLNTSVFSKSELASLTSTVGGEEGVFGVPWQTDGRMLYYNVDQVNELKNVSDTEWNNTQAVKKGYLEATGVPDDLIGDKDWDGDGVNDVRGPKSWGELMAYAELLTEKKGDGTIERLGFHFDVGNNSILNLIWNKGGEVFDENGNAIVYKDGKADETIKEAYQTWYDINRLFPVAQTNGFIDGSGSTDTSNLFYTGQVSMMIETNEIPWEYDKIEAAATSEDDLMTVGVCSLPYADLANPEDRANFSGGFSLEITTRLLDYDKAVAQAAYDFVEFLMSEEVQLSIVENINNMPGNTDVYDQLIAQEQAKGDDADPVKIFVFQEMDYRRPMDYISNAANWINDLTDNLTEYVSGKQTDLDKALENAQKDIERRQATA